MFASELRLGNADNFFIALFSSQKLIPKKTNSHLNLYGFAVCIYYITIKQISQTHEIYLE